MRHEPPHVHPLHPPRHLLGATDDVATDLHAVLCGLHLLHFCRNLRHHPMFQLVNPWVAVDIVLDPRYKIPHRGQLAPHLKHPMAACLTNKGHVEIRQVEDDPRPVPVRINGAHAAPNIHPLTSHGAEEDTEEPVEDVVQQQHDSGQNDHWKIKHGEQPKTHPKTNGPFDCLRALLEQALIATQHQHGRNLQQQRWDEKH
mmetsp:Transcript_7389/g.12834  ORF Transcript_7389/g.12834 Transcript_7389/m.12834 type:complete len:200 (-) Transcript_7389:329-928(-)